MPEGTREAPFTMDPGTYRLGDPCYSVPDKRWQEWLDRADASRRNLSAELDGHMIVALGTKHGDGEYMDSQMKMYGVDAGLIGLVPVDLPDIRDDWGDDLRAAQSGIYHVHTFTRPFTVWAEDDGTLHFENVQIFTGEEE